MKRNLLLVIAWWIALINPALVRAITFGPFGAAGQGGAKNGQALVIAPGSDVYELDGFLRLGGLDLNGDQIGTSAQLSQDPLPSGLVYKFSSALGTNSSDLLLTYFFSNATSSVTYSNIAFFVLVDPEIDEATNTFFNEFGTTSGSAGFDLMDASLWQIDEPGFQNGLLLRNLLAGSLSNSNSIPPGSADDVAMSLGFTRNLLWPGDTLSVQVMVSQADHALGTFALVQHDQADASTRITFSGQSSHGGLAGTIFGDSNTNGLPDPGEGLSNVVMVLQDTNGATLARMFTDPNGHYDFGTPPGGGPFTVSVTPSSLPVNSTNNVAHPVPGTEYSATRTLTGTNAVLNWGYAAPARQFINADGLVQIGFLHWQLNRATGSLLGTLTITNPVSSSLEFGPPYQLGLKASTNFYYPHAGGLLSDGLPYVDVSSGVQAQVADGLLKVGQTVQLTNAVEVYSLTRSIPPLELFEIWATRH